MANTNKQFLTQIIHTLQSKNPFVDSDLSFLKALPILQGTWRFVIEFFKVVSVFTSRSITLSENLNVPGLAFRIALAVIFSQGRSFAAFRFSPLKIYSFV